MLAAGAAGIGLPLLQARFARSAAPSVEYTVLDGGRRHLADLKGRVVLVNFWATSCGSCVREMPLLADTHRKFASRGFETLAVSMSYDAPAAVADFAERHALPFAVAIDNTGEIARRFGDVALTPTTLLIDRRGAIVRRFTGVPDFKALHGQVEALLAEG